MLLRFDGQPEVDEEVYKLHMLQALKFPLCSEISESSCRGISYTGFHHYSVLLLHRGALGKNMWEESGLIGLEG